MPSTMALMPSRPPAAVTATAVPFAVVVLGYRAAETALNRRDAAIAAGQP